MVGRCARAQEILERKLAGLPAQQLSRDDREWLVASTPGWSGADLDNLCREAALYALRHDITASHVRNPLQTNVTPTPIVVADVLHLGRVARGLLKLTPLRCRCWCCVVAPTTGGAGPFRSSSAAPPVQRHGLTRKKTKRIILRHFFDSSNLNLRSFGDEA